MSEINVLNAVEFIAIVCLYLLPILIVYKILKNFRRLKLQEKEKVMIAREQNKVLGDINKNLILIGNILMEGKGNRDK